MKDESEIRDNVHKNLEHTTLYETRNTLHTTSTSETAGLIPKDCP
jgi:hypothetical protein